MVDTLAFFMFLAKLDLKNANAILKAHKDFRKMKNNYRGFNHVPEKFHFPGSNRNIILERYILNKKQ